VRCIRGSDIAQAPLHALDLIRILADHAVDYVVIGGFAAIAHGSPRTTRDLDIVVAPDNDNLVNLCAALDELTALRRLPEGGTRPFEPADVATIALGTTLHTLTRAGALDVVGRPAGAPGYADLRARAISVAVADREVLVAGLDDLIAMKRAAGRPLDLQDIADLTEPRA
jgi:hypothetical protein